MTPPQPHGEETQSPHTRRATRSQSVKQRHPVGTAHHTRHVSRSKAVFERYKRIKPNQHTEQITTDNDRIMQLKACNWMLESLTQCFKPAQ